jgi:hypothetical protein
MDVPAKCLKNEEKKEMYQLLIIKLNVLELVKIV